ncbi:hypothetical protein V5098_03465 [Vibrio coralliirubri]|uniref:hypothetical protein n=1 Tax=Vibrio TaxID=662 RepID=UPI000632BC89|nr:MULTISPECIES: hypothetical protein [Vibrio]MCK8076641.1 hypothetical protein [Vibrio sp. 1CM2L]MCK8088005.1 hypothetical protein [Vibrio sp. 1CM8B]CDT81946.1 Conserved protein of unkwown function [Vibrio coralliirubri]
MGEKTKVPSITDTFEIDGIFYTDNHVDLYTPELEAKRALYEQINHHSNRGRNIDEEV